MRAPDLWREKGPLAGLLRPIAAIYGDMARARLMREAPRAELPAIVVGGPTSGGDGKTPLALALAERLIALGERPALLTRGYGRRSGATTIIVDPGRHAADDVGDEALLLARVATTIVGADRVASAKLAKERGASVLVLDDGFHSRALAADLALLVIDSDYGAGNGYCLPAGPLRAPLDAQFAVADALVVAGEGANGAAVAALAGKPVLKARLAPDPHAAAALKDARVVAFAGIARPQKFFNSLTEIGANIAMSQSFGDHHQYRERELSGLAALRRRFGARLVTTEKDAARIGAAMAAHGIDVLPVTLGFADVPALDALLQGALSRAS